MDITITPKKLKGDLTLIPSKSQAHRYLICAAFSDKPTTIICPAINRDIEATATCLNALGATITYKENRYHVIPTKYIPSFAILPCAESGSTLRFMLPIIGALGVNAQFLLEGRLPQRPLSPLWEEMVRMGCTLDWIDQNTLRCTGKLRSGNYTINGSVSSQFITGLLFALSLIPGKSQLVIDGTVESRPYIEMTKLALADFGVDVTDITLCGRYPFSSPGVVVIEGDWSNGAFFHVANYLGSGVDIRGLNDKSPQGDRVIVDILKNFGQFAEINAMNIPDLVPVLSVAATRYGARFTNIRRLRLKESDRVESVINMLSALGIQSVSDENTLTVYPGTISGGTVDSANDHRIAMAAAVAATVATGTVTILDAQCVAKSYPTFWVEYGKLGGTYEQYIR